MHNSYIAHSFKQLYGQLSGLKTEIEHIQHLLEKSRVELQKDFEQWWEKQTTEGKVGRQPFYLSIKVDNLSYHFTVFLLWGAKV